MLLDFWVRHWLRSPGSPESQEALEVLQKDAEGVLSQPRLAAFVCFPVCAGGHWTLLSLTRAATPDGHEQPNKLVVAYQDSLPGLPSQICKARATAALGLAVQVFGEQQTQTVLPEQARSAKQTDGHSCGFFVLSMMEEHYNIALQCYNNGSNARVI